MSKRNEPPYSLLAKNASLPQPSELAFAKKSSPQRKLIRVRLIPFASGLRNEGIAEVALGAIGRRNWSSDFIPVDCYITCEERLSCRRLPFTLARSSLSCNNTCSTLNLVHFLACWGPSFAVVSFGQRAGRPS